MDQEIKHPQEILDPALADIIRQHAFIMEATGQLPAVVLDLIYQQRWLQLMVPRSCGGLETSLPGAVQLFEALAWAEANTGWCVNLGAGANMFAGYFEEATALSIFNTPQTCCAGSGALSGKAKRTEGGYNLTGRWKYASGANHATHFTANAWLLDEQDTPLLEDGQPSFRSFIVPAAQIINHHNWHAMGLKATSSNDFEARDIFVPEAQVFNLQQASAFATGPLYSFPFEQLAVVDMACMLTGITLHFIDLYTALAATKKPAHSEQLLKDNPKAIAIADNVITAFHEARKNMYAMLDTIWSVYEHNAEADEAQLAALSSAARQAAERGREAINALYPLCGMSILDPSTELNKVWRDAMTAGQHYLLTPVYG